MGAEPTEREARRRQGRYYTPAAVVRDMVRRALDERPAPRRVLEPAVGDGRFLAALALDSAELVGVDADPVALASARERLPAARLVEGDALAWLAPGREEPGLFDLVLGNPPYGLVPEASQRDWLRRTYRRHRGPFDRYRLFLEACLGRLAPGGRLVLLLPTTWQGLRHAAPLREWIARDFAWRAVVHYDWEVFPEAEVRVAAFVIDRAPPSGASPTVLRVAADGGEVKEAPEGNEALLRGLAARHPRLDARFLVSSGLKPYQRGKGQPPQAGHEGRARLFEATEPEDPSCRPLLVGRHVQPYRDRWEEDSWLRYGPWLAEPREVAWFDAPLKIVGRQTGDRLVACLDDERRVARDSTWLVRPRAATSKDELLWLLAVLNDPIATALFRHGEPDEVGKVFAQVRVGSVRRLPCPPLSALPAAAQAAALAALRERLARPAPARAAACEASLRALVRQAYGLGAEERS